MTEILISYTQIADALDSTSLNVRREHMHADISLPDNKPLACNYFIGKEPPSKNHLICIHRYTLDSIQCKNTWQV